MLYHQDRLDSLNLVLRQLQLNNSSLDRPVALGIKGGAQNGLDVWFIMHITNGSVASVEYRVSGSMVDIDEELGVSIVVQATDAHWHEIGNGGVDAAVEAADRKIFAVSGKLPYFIRHVRSTVDLVSAFAGTLSNAAPT